jgi:diphthine synthase
MPIRALDALGASSEVFLESYTNLIDTGYKSELEEKIMNKIKTIGREDVESAFLVEKARSADIALLVPGDPLAATTHMALISQCIKENVQYRIIHASSIFSAVGETGLSMYKFGGASSIPIYYENFHPDSFMDVIKANREIGLHSLVLLEAKSEEEFVKTGDALEIINNAAVKRGMEPVKPAEVVVVSRLGSETQVIATLDELSTEPLPPTALIIPGNLSRIENEFLQELRRRQSERPSV